MIDAITSQCPELAVYLSGFPGIFLVECDKAVGVFLPELLINMRSEKHTLLIVLYRLRSLSYCVRRNGTSTPRFCATVSTNTGILLHHLEAERGPPFLVFTLQAFLFLL